jgi:large subunit ribosomal protein L4
MGEKSGTAKKKTAATLAAMKQKAAKAKAPKSPVKAAKKKTATRKPATAKAKKDGAEQRAVPEGSVAVVNADNKRISDLVLHPEVFGVEVNDHLLYEAVKQYRAGARSGTHATKNRALVSGSGKKPWRQKGTGRARVGETRTPLWRHGGTVFGPQPRDYSYSMPKKARHAALRSALSQRVKEGAMTVIDQFDIAVPKTRELVAILGKLKVAGKTLLVDHKPADNLVLSGRNIPGLKVVDPTQVNVYDVLDCRNLLVTQEALTKLEERLTP